MGELDRADVERAADLETAATNMIMASLAGVEGARGLATKVIAALSEPSRMNIVERVKWADLTFILGPLVEGHHDRVREWQKTDDGSDGAPWLQYERETADILFRDKRQSGDSVLTPAFGEKVAIKAFSVVRADVRGERVAATTINLRDIVLADGFPVYWKPDTEALRALGTLLGVMAGRHWVEWLYSKY